MEKLSKRQKEIIRLKMFGLRDREISTMLNISYGTVRTHIDRAKLKCRCGSIAQLVTTAYIQALRKKELV